MIFPLDLLGIKYNTTTPLRGLLWPIEITSPNSSVSESHHIEPGVAGIDSMAASVLAADSLTKC